MKVSIKLTDLSKIFIWGGLGLQLAFSVMALVSWDARILLCCNVPLLIATCMMVITSEYLWRLG